MSDNPMSVYNPNRSGGVWLLSQLFNKELNPNGIVPNVNDAVIDWSQGLLRVTDVYTDGTYKLENPNFDNVESLDEFARLFGSGPGDQASSARVYVDNTVFPHRLCVDAAVCFYGSEKKEVKIFRGTNIHDPAAIVSAVYDSSLNYVSDTIPLEVVARDDVNNLSVKSVKEAHCSDKLHEGENLTLVVLNTSGSISKVKELVVKETNFIVAPESAVNRVTHVELVSPFMSVTNPNVLEVPINVPISSLALTAKVHYENRVVDKVIDGSKLILHGADDYISTVIGQPQDLVLNYNLSDNETSVNTIGYNTKHVSAKYTAISTVTEGSYSVKLFVVPKWINEYSGYELDYYLYDLDRSDFHLVTQFVEAGLSSSVFDGLKYGSLQRITVAIDLSDVDPRLKEYRHVQQFGISLMANGLSDSTGWLIQYDLSKANEYGRDVALHAVMMSIGNWELDISCGLTDYDEWLDKVYYNSLPLYDTRSESKAPAPTHFVLEINGIRNEYELATWNDTLTSITGGSEGKSAVLEWKRRVGGTVLNLGCSPLRIIHDAR